MPPIDGVQVGSRIARGRRENGLTQGDLARHLGISVRSVQNYEAGVSVPYRHVRAIEALFRKPAGWLLEGGDREENDPALFTRIGELRAALEHHYSLLQVHLETLSQTSERLRDEAGRRRDARRAPEIGDGAAANGRSAARSDDADEAGG